MSTARFFDGVPVKLLQHGVPNSEWMFLKDIVRQDALDTLTRRCPVFGGTCEYSLDTTGLPMSHLCGEQTQSSFIGRRGQPSLSRIGPSLTAIRSQSASMTQRKPMLPVELSGVFFERAATRYRLHHDRWQRYDPPRITRWLPSGGPIGFS